MILCPVFMRDTKSCKKYLTQWSYSVVQVTPLMSPATPKENIVI